jgi:GT2 family glycosyltransferase
MDPVFFFYGDDPDWCYRFSKAGWEVRFYPDASIVHFGGQSTRQERRAFRLQLAGSQLIFCRLHRSWAAFQAARLLSALFFGIRIPYWLAKAALGGERRASLAETAGTYALGAFYCLFDWKSLVMNRSELERRLSGGGARAS